jgi:hypothetical protein
MRQLTLNLGYDTDTESPLEMDDGGWKLVSFNRRHAPYEDPYKYLTPASTVHDPRPATIGLARKLAVGTAFWLSCYEHSGFAWSLKGEGMQCQWDTTQLAGIFLWTGKVKDMGAKTLADRAEDARAYLDEYNTWANGGNYWFGLEDSETGELLESVGGFIGEEALESGLADVLEAGDVVKIEGEAAGMSQYLKLPDGVQLAD